MDSSTGVPPSDLRPPSATDAGVFGDGQRNAHQTWNNVGYNTYQPIAGGAHILMDTRDSSPDGRIGRGYCFNCPRTSRALRFVANYYDSSRMPPTAFEVWYH